MRRKIFQTGENFLGRAPVERGRTDGVLHDDIVRGVDVVVVVAVVVVLELFPGRQVGGLCRRVAASDRSWVVDKA
jgi:hypothetical protein